MKNQSLKHGLFENKYLIGAFILGTIMQTGVVLVPGVAKVFDLVPLTNIQWIYCAIISICPVIIMEAQKKLNEEKFGKIVYKEYSKVN